MKKLALERKLTILILTTAVGCLSLAHKALADDGLDAATLEGAQRSMARGLRWLEANQAEDGSWSAHPAITSLAVAAFLGSGEYGEDDPVIKKGLEYILKHVKPNGAIFKDEMPNYNTSVCMMALLATNNPKYHDIVRKARRYLVDLQCDESEDYSESNWFYGGIGYGGDERPDMSNIQWALEALKYSEFLETERPNSAPSLSPDAAEAKRMIAVEKSISSGLYWTKAIKFLDRCQNLKKTNDQPWAGDDGGFVYFPGNSKAGGTKSYGSMTYAGLKSFLYAKVDKKDPRVQGAFKWITNHYTVEENPLMGKQGLYYSYHTMAKALNAYGEDIIADAKGVKHYWRKELGEKLISLQHDDGHWVNSNGRWWENNKVLVTSYCVLTLEILCSNSLKTTR